MSPDRKSAPTVPEPTDGVTRDAQTREMERRLEEAVERYSFFFDFSPVGYLMLDRSATVLEANPASATLLARDRATIVGRPLVSILPDRERPGFLDYMRQMFLSGETHVGEFPVITPAGALRRVRLEGAVAQGSDESAICHLIASEPGARAQASEMDRLTARVVESAAEGILITDANGIIQLVNPAFERSTGYTLREALGASPNLLKSGRHDEEFYRNMWLTLNKEGQWQGEIWNRGKNGEVYPEWLSVTAVKDDRGRVTHYVGIFSDAHTQEFILERLRYLANFDALTGLPNRRLYMDRLYLALSHSRRYGQMAAVMFIDLDHFKEINDSLGHKIGDAVLVAVTDRMKSCLRDGDTLARLGGDEFTVILPNIPHPDGATNVARKLLDCFVHPVEIDNRELRISASIGISIFPDDGEDPDDLLNCADIAMYRIKESGRNGYLRCGEQAP